MSFVNWMNAHPNAGGCIGIAVGVAAVLLVGLLDRYAK